MAANTYKEALIAARQELSELLTKRAELDARIARLRETVVSLAYLVNDAGQTESLDVADLGLTDAVAKVLRLSGMALSPANIRDELERLGFDTKKYTDIIPNITKVLQRLNIKGHVDISIPGKGERRLYIWSPMQPSRHLREVCPKCFGTGLELVPGMGARTCDCRQAGPPIIDPFVGHGSTPAKTDIVITNPPYSTPKSKERGTGKNKQQGAPAKSSVSYEQLGLRPPKSQKVDPGKRDVSVLDQRQKKD